MNAKVSSQIVRKSRVADDFGQAAARYDEVARLQRQVGEQLMTRLRPGEAGHVLDLGCGTGYFLPRLLEALAPAQLTASDLSPGMIRYAREQRGVAADWLVADAESLPLGDASVDQVFSSLMIQWCSDPVAVLREVRRVLKPGGEAVFSTLTDGTLHELREAWAQADPGVEHVNQFRSRSEYEQLIKSVFDHAGIESVPLTFWYPDAMALLHELKELGARYKDEGRRAGVTAPGRFRRLKQAYEQWRDPAKGLPATWQVAFIHIQG